MLTKTLHRNIPPERENTNDSFRVRYNDKSGFDRLKVIIKRNWDESVQEFLFDAGNLPEKDSIHFTTTIHDNKMLVKWKGGIQPILISEPTIIELKPEWFIPGYYVYIVVINYSDQQYYYVGMTGDRKYETARSPFYRLSGHFSQVEKSTQNQIIKGLKKKMENEDIDTVLAKSTFTYYCYLIEKFDNNDVRFHVDKRVKGEQIESYLIQKLRKAYGNNSVFNKKYSSKVSQTKLNETTAGTASQVYSNFISLQNATMEKE